MSKPTYRVEKSQDGKWRVGTWTVIPWDGSRGGSEHGEWRWYPSGTEEAAMRAYEGLVDTAKEVKKKKEKEDNRIWTLVEEE